MGWWSETIMGGDGPLDYRGEYEDIIVKVNAIKSREDYDYKFTKAQVEKALPKLLAAARRANDDDYDPGVAGQVLGALVMEHGAKMTDTARKFFIASAKKDNQDFKDPKKRQAVLKDFIKKVTAYTGKRRVHLTREGLFDVLFKKLDEG